MILYSFVVPIYNSSKYIENTLSSIDDNCDAEYEVILVDDKSEDIDDIYNIIKKYKNVKVIEKEIKSNAAESRNIGFNLSKGRFVFFLDSDDKILYGYTKERKKMHNNSECGVIFGSFNVLTKENGKPVPCIGPDYSINEDIRDFIFFKNGDFRSSTLSIDKNFFKGTLFDIKSFKHQDWIFGIRCFDNKEKIIKDYNCGVLIDETPSNRMSSSLNIEASKYLVNNYLTKKEHICSLSIKHWKISILNKDRNACKYYYSLYKNNDIYKIVFFFIIKFNMFTVGKFGITFYKFFKKW